ncbi:MAG: divergent polysaccharide deacetylase family protein [Pseudomonadota bacterium]
MTESIDDETRGRGFSLGRFVAGILTGVILVGLTIGLLGPDREVSETSLSAGEKTDSAASSADSGANAEIDQKAALPVEEQRVLITPEVTGSQPAEVPDTPEALSPQEAPDPASSPQSGLPATPPPETQTAPDAQDPNLAVRATPETAPTSDPAWQRNAVPFESAPDTPLIAIILEAPNESDIPQDLILGLGLPITLAVTPWSDVEATFGVSAKAAGYEIVARLPVRDREDQSSAVEVIHPGLSAPEVQDLTQRYLARMPSVVAASHFGGRLASRNTALMRAMVREIEAAGFAYIDQPGRTTQSAPAARTTTTPMVSKISRIAGGLTDQQVYRLIESAAQAASRDGNAVMSVVTERASLIGIQRWALERNGKVARLAPLSAVLSRL